MNAVQDEVKKYVEKLEAFSCRVLVIGFLFIVVCLGFAGWSGNLYSDLVQKIIECWGIGYAINLGMLFSEYLILFKIEAKELEALNICPSISTNFHSN